MLTSFSTALSGLSAFSTAIDVVGNNLANLNTPGFKQSAVSFHDLVTQSLGAGLGETQVGFGVGRPITLRQFSQGAIQSSAGPLDAAIQGQAGLGKCLDEATSAHSDGPDETFEVVHGTCRKIVQDNCGVLLRDALLHGSVYPAIRIEPVLRYRIP